MKIEKGTINEENYSGGCLKNIYFPDYENMTYVFLIEQMKEDTGVSVERLAECVYKHMLEANGEFAGYVVTGRI